MAMDEHATTDSTAGTDTRSLTPCLLTHLTDDQLKFYEEALAFKPNCTARGSGGRIPYCDLKNKHGSLLVRGGVVFNAPVRVAIRVHVADVDALYRQATEHGAISLSPPKDVYWGGRACILQDPDGHAWMFVSTNAEPFNFAGLV